MAQDSREHLIQELLVAMMDAVQEIRDCLPDRKTVSNIEESVQRIDQVSRSTFQFVSRLEKKLTLMQKQLDTLRSNLGKDVRESG